MSQTLLFSTTGVLMFAIGLYGLTAHAHLLRKILGLNIMGNGVFLLLVAIARRTPDSDPVPHALVLTGIVITVSATAFGLMLLRRLYRDSRATNLPEERQDREHREREEP